MLSHSGPIASDNTIVGSIHKHRAHDRLFGHDLAAFSADTAKARLLIKASAKPWTVKAVNAPDPLLYLLRSTGCRIQSQISSLGMASEDHSSFRIAGSSFEICQRALLSRNSLHIAHVEVLFPPHKRLICSPERDIDTRPAKQEGDSCKLSLLLLIKPFFIAGGPHLPVPAA